MARADTISARQTAAGLTPRRSRYLICILLLTVAVGLVSRAGKSLTPDYVDDILSAAVVFTGCATVVALMAFTVQRGWLTWLMVGAGVSFVFGQGLVITEHISVLNSVPILGRDSAYHTAIFRVLDFLGLSMWVVGFFGAVFELNRAKTQLAERSRALATEMERTEQAVRDLSTSEDRYRRIVEESSDIIFQCNLEGEFTYANKRAAKVMGCTIDKILGETFVTFLAPELRDEVRQRVRNQVLDRQDVLYLEFPARRQDGSKLWIGQNNTLRYENGRPIGIHAVARDITERKAAELALRASEERYRQLVEATGVIPWEADAHTMNITYIGPQAEAVFGYPVEQWYEDGFWQSILHPEDRDAAVDFCVAQTQSSLDHQFDYRVLTARGDTIWVRDIVSVVGTDGKPELLRGIFVDITAMKEAEEDRRKLREQMLQAQKLESLGVLAGGIAHDFNNLLAGILGNAEMALHLPGAASDCLETVIATAQRAGEMCQQLLAYSGRGKIVVQPHDISDIVQEMGDLLQLPVTKKARLEYRLADDLPTIEGDGTQVRQVILNLVTNATESFVDSSGTITLSTGVTTIDAAPRDDTRLHGEIAPGEYVYFQVEDTGSGMDRQTQERMFEPFYTTKFSGRGLGLAAVLGIMRGHHGGIRVRSEVGEGTSIRLLFPVSGKPVPIASAAGGSNGRWRGEGLVLVVDDEAVIREFVTTVLMQTGFTVVTAADGAQAVRQFRRHVDDLVAVVLDLTMPVMDGTHAHREMREIREGVPVVVISGFSETEAMHGFEGSSISGFVQKPFRREELITAIKEAVVGCV